MSAPTPATAAGSVETAEWDSAVASLADADDDTALLTAGRVLDAMEAGLSSL